MGESVVACTQMIQLFQSSRLGNQFHVGDSDPESFGRQRQTLVSACCRIYACNRTSVEMKKYERKRVNMALLDRCCFHFSDERRQARSPTREGSGYEIRDKRDETRGVSHAREV